MTDSDQAAAAASTALDPRRWRILAMLGVAQLMLLGGKAADVFGPRRLGLFTGAELSRALGVWSGLVAAVAAVAGLLSLAPPKEATDA